MASSSAQKLGTFCDAQRFGGGMRLMSESGARPERGPRPVESCTVETTTCFHHTDRPTGRACTRCGRPACPDCLREAAVGSHCFECVRAARPPAAQRVRQRAAGAGAVVTKALVALNGAVFLLTSLSPGGSLTGDGASRLTARLALF